MDRNDRNWMRQGVARPITRTQSSGADEVKTTLGLWVPLPDSNTANDSAASLTLDVASWIMGFPKGWPFHATETNIFRRPKVANPWQIWQAVLANPHGREVIL